MNAFLRWLACLSIVVAGLASVTPFDSLSTAIAASAVALVGIVERYAHRLSLSTDAKKRRRRPIRFEPLRQLILGIVHGVALLLLTLLLSQSVKQIPGLCEVWYDRDRHELDAVMDALERTGQSQELDRIIEDRLRHRTSTAFRAALNERSFRNAVHAVWGTTGDQQSKWISKSERLAHELGHDLSAIEILKASLTDHAEVKRLQSLQIRTVETVAHDRQDMDAANEAAAKSLVEKLQSWGQSEDMPLPQRQNIVEYAVQVAGKNMLPTDTLNSALASLKQSQLLEQPRDLPTGAKARLVSADFHLAPPIAVLDIEITDSQGRPIHDLARKDFRLRHGTELSKKLLSEATRAETSGGNVMLLFDHSGSMKGTPIDEAKNAAQSFLSSLSPTSHKCTIAFSTTVTRLGEWSSDVGSQLIRIGELRAEGNTALYQAIAAAIDALRNVPEPRAIALFTDGRDTVGGPDLNSLIADCRTRSIIVFVVGLKTADLQEDLLKHLASDTGGLYLGAEKASAIRSRFAQISDRLRTDVFRIIAPIESVNDPIIVRVGRQNYLEVEYRLAPDQSVSAATR